MEFPYNYDDQDYHSTDRQRASFGHWVVGGYLLAITIIVMIPFGDAVNDDGSVVASVISSSSVRSLKDGQWNSIS